MAKKNKQPVYGTMSRLTTLGSTLRDRSFSFQSTSMTPKRSTLLRADEVETVNKAPTVYYTPKAFNQIQYIVEKAPKEIGWMGLVDELKGGDYLITEIFIPEQTVSAVETDIDSDAMADLGLHLLENDLDPGQLYYWGHSHVDMEVSPSMQDEEQVDEFLESCPKFIRGIYNKAGDSKVDVYLRDENCVYECVTNKLYISDEEKKALDEALAKNVKNQVRAVTKSVSASSFGKSTSTQQNAKVEPAGSGYRIQNGDFYYDGMYDWPNYDM